MYQAGFKSRRSGNICSSSPAAGLGKEHAMDGTGFECKYDLQENYLVFDANGQFFGIPHSRVISIDVER